jgi:hypothetical protein
MTILIPSISCTLCFGYGKIGRDKGVKNWWCVLKKFGLMF